jgi:hypothetical protein
MEKYRLAIGSQANVELDPAAAKGFGLVQGRERVLGRADRGTAMANYPRQNLFEAGAPRRDPASAYQVAAFACCSWRSGRREPRSSPVS